MKRASHPIAVSESAVVTMKANASVSPAEKQHLGLESFNASVWQEQRVTMWLMKLDVYKAHGDNS